MFLKTSKVDLNKKGETYYAHGPEDKVEMSAAHNQPKIQSISTDELTDD